MGLNLGPDNELAHRPTMPAIGRGVIRLMMPCALVVLMMTVGLLVQPAVASATQSTSASAFPHGSDPDCTSYTVPANGAIVQICATPTELNFAWANEPPGVYEAVAFEGDQTQTYYQYEMSVPSSGSQCLFIQV